MYFYTLIVILVVHVIGKPNFVIILTDDVDLTLHSVDSMKSSRKLIAEQGATFTNAYVNSPICCPSRGSILTGKYPHNIQLYNNSISGGCSSQNWQTNHEKATIATILHSQANYTTFYAGKYLNQYGDQTVGGLKHVPVGWDWWYGLKGNSKYYNYSLSINGSHATFKNTYFTDLITKKSIRFLNATNGPFLMFLAPPAAHAPFTPAEKYALKYPGVVCDRKAPFNSTPANKHWLVGMQPVKLPSNVTILDEIYRNRLRTLQSVDRMVRKVVKMLERRSILNNTYLIFTSDNGYHLGQFTQPWDKRQPYESDIHVPFMVRGPGVGRNVKLDYPIAAVDLAPSILDLANVQFEQYGFDGKSFKNELFGETKPYEKFILIEYWGEGNENSVDKKCGLENDGNLAECRWESWCKCQDAKNNTYSCLLHFIQIEQVKVKFCRFVDGFYEIYDLVKDEKELVNLWDTFPAYNFRKYETILNSLSSTF